MPLVRFAGGTWRVGGLLALSRAFGDAYLKGSLQFEGRSSGNNDYSSGMRLRSRAASSGSQGSQPLSYL